MNSQRLQQHRQDLRTQANKTPEWTEEVGQEVSLSGALATDSFREKNLFKGVILLG